MIHFCMAMAMIIRAIFLLPPAALLPVFIIVLLQRLNCGRSLKFCITMSRKRKRATRNEKNISSNHQNNVNDNEEELVDKLLPHSIPREERRRIWNEEASRWAKSWGITKEEYLERADNTIKYLRSKENQCIRKRRSHS